MSLRDRLGAVTPSSYRGRIALAIVVALVVAVVGVQLALNVLVTQQVQSAVEANLRQQGQEIAATYRRAGHDGVAQAQRYMPGTQVVVRRNGETVYWSDPVQVLDAQAVVTDGDLQVTLQHEASAGVIGQWALPLIIIGVVLVIGGVAWWLAGLASRRLRREASALAAQAEAVAGGDLDARVEVSDDELTRVATSLNAMTQRLSDSDARQRVFLADVAHELRTPVTAIDGFAQALVDGTISTDEGQREAAEIIHEESQRLSGLVADLQALTVAALDAEPVREPTDVVALAREAAVRLEAAAAERGVLLRGPDATQESIVVPTNAAHVQTILGNLVSNALRATPAGGTVRVGVQVVGDDAVIAVSDTGVGIAPEHLPHIFDRMYRVDAARDRDSGGTGLGLAIVAGLTQSLGGRIEVQSAPGEGSRFALSLPLDRA